uniref:Uncharacterized protein n=1 Tax=Anguilla anguilla TaxID=7936 RepID=A0A0E9WZZ1_ANGAN
MDGDFFSVDLRSLALFLLTLLNKHKYRKYSDFSMILKLFLSIFFTFFKE